MGTFIRIFIAALTIGAGVLYKNYSDLAKPGPRPNLDEREYWGPNNEAEYKENNAIKAFDISVKPEYIADLKTQLSRPLKLAKPLKDVGFEYGFNTKELRNVVKYWRDTYLSKWSERETYLKKFPHYQTEVQGLKIHFLHVKPKQTEGKKVLPLLLLHGWPGSIREFYDFIPFLTTSNEKSEYVFEVIAPSLPGYGWSQGASKVGFGPAQVAVVMRNLMLRIGHKKFVVQGGDWGAIIGSNLASLFPENVIAIHSNMCHSNSLLARIKMILVGIFPRFTVDNEYADFYQNNFPFLLEETGYFHLQATKPDTIGSVLSDNPVGLAAYILEKFSTWTNPAYKKLADGGLTKHFTLDALLDNVMIYYVTDSITTSQRLYAEGFSFAQMALNVDSLPVKAPSGCVRFKHEIAHTPDFQLKDKHVNLVHSTHYRNGGHFPAFEVPEQLYTDFIAFIKKAVH